MVWFVNFQKTEHLSVNDRGFSYGDGVFETMLFQNKEVRHSQLHQNRLRRSLQRLFFDAKSSLDLNGIWSFIHANAPSFGESVLVKLIVTRGEGGRGYLPPEHPQLNVLIYFGKPPCYANERVNGVKLGVSSIPTSINPSVAGLKHLNKLENVMAKRELASGFYDALMLDPKGYVAECIQSNIGWFKNNLLYMPSIVDSGVQGTMRSFILEEFDGVINVGCFTLDDLLRADEVFVCNSLMGISGVVSIENPRTLGCIGIETEISAFCRYYSIGENIKNVQSLLESKENHVCS
ncbi:aminodeoxychorismate lyase [Marinomonas mediterranea]|uniref:aminodeoxychorismate lyase n=1 Tax=Marinomonas mediterranea TaxID=119864 RepID=UPI0023492632|nr:aminodeoxychorismate lyase [Marinomonas mediterranea]WCN09499.1 aminodeoxychorismate lyase [Marinomonas mediterranea]